MSWMASLAWHSSAPACLFVLLQEYCHSGQRAISIKSAATINTNVNILRAFQKNDAQDYGYIGQHIDLTL